LVSLVGRLSSIQLQPFSVSSIPLYLPRDRPSCSSSSVRVSATPRHGTSLYFTSKFGGG
jgi:hypothetical protein